MREIELPAMGEVELPYVDGAVTIEHALRVTRVHDRSGVVTGSPNASFVLTDEDLAGALRDHGDIAIGKVTPLHRTVQAPEPKPHVARSLVFREHAAQPSVIETMQAQNAQFGLVAAMALSVQVLTISESLSDILGKRQLLCRCRTNPRHLWRPAQLAVAGKCNSDGDPVDCS